ncbi:Gfo/Idh/MocA family protein [Oceanobacillus bengalensis]|uniref:Gfo/Idh/MocA family oxidoreductase n=1 Tax=Oceanobacillus bengalensis TaxID=1435466 RepID=A0A494Z3H9_9BACI|nr:Gfo/Idh/MocA family oxidoreductase [Oceanobacillus bengalensis]RKQ17078.1 gfo/Idh/MocA family oxidoreductase [Oceanobacillus bengalensis]
MQRVAIVGLGFIGKTHLEAYRKVPYATVTVICNRQGRKDEVNFVGTIVSDYDELLRRKDIDVVDLCVPTFLHEEYITKAAEAGKHIICEKPLTLTVQAANRIKQVINKHGVRLFVGHLLRFWPEYQTIKAYSETGKIKNIDVVHAKRLGQIPNWSEWFQYPEKGGGALFDLHIHDIDFVSYLLGKIASVYAVGQQNQYGAWEHIMTTLTFKNQAKAFVEASHRMPKGYPFTMSLRAQSRSSVLDFTLTAGENIEHINDSHLVYYEENQLSELHDTQQADAFQNELTYFIDCLEHDQKNDIVPLDDVLYIIKVLQDIEKSLKTGQEVQVL